MSQPRRQKLTKQFIESIKPPEKGRKNYWDTKQPKLCLRVTSSGAKTFYYVTKFGSKVEWTKLDRYPELTPEQARTKAILTAAEYAAGKSPVQERQIARGEWTIEQAWTQYKANLELRGRSRSNLDGYWEQHFKRWKDKRLSEITPKMAAALQAGLLERLSAGSVNRICAVGKALFNFAGRSPLSSYEGANPFNKVEKLPVQLRKTRILPHQIGAFFKALELVNDDMRDIFLLALYSGRRRGEILTMRWVDVDLETGTWMVPQTKAGEPQITALPSPAVKLISKRDRGSTWVFPSERSVSGHITETKRAWDIVRNEAGMPELRLHDLRRTLSSIGQEQNVAVAVMQQTLGHKDPQTTLKHYTDIAITVQRQALEALAETIDRAAEKQ